MPLESLLQIINMKIHELEYQVMIDRLNIEIKFPCKITASFRVGKLEGQSGESVSLQNGVTKFTQPITTKGLMHLIDGKYQQKKSYLTIYVLSNSGKNIAGVSTLDLATLTSQSWQTIEKQLQRCPDRNASISLRIRSSFIREVEQSPSQSGNSEDLRGLKDLIRREDLSVTVPETRSQKYRLQNTPSRETRIASTSLVPEHIMVRERSSHSFRADTHEQPKTSDRVFMRGEDMEKNRCISDLKDQVTERERKITRLEVEKQSYLREVEGLRGQLDVAKAQATTKANKQVELIGENEGLKRKLQSTENAYEILKMKRAQWQKRETERRQLSLNQKNLSEDLKLKSQQIADLEKELKVSKKAREDLDKMVREKMRQLRELSEKCDDLTTTVSTLQKRLEMKQTFYKEQIKKYNERQNQIDNERQRLYREISTLRDAIDDKQRKINQNSKDSDKVWAEQKIKLTKKTETIKAELETTQLNYQNTMKQLNAQTQQVDRLQKQLYDSSQQVEKVKLQLERTKKQLIVQTNYRVKYEEQQKQKSTLKQQKAGLQKQLDDFLSAKNMDIQDMNRQITQKTEQLKSLNERLTDQSKKIREKDTKIQQLQNNFDALTKKYQLLRKSDEKKSVQITGLKSNEKNLLLDLQSLDQQNQQLQLTIQNMKFKQEAEIEQIKKLLKKSGEECEGLKFKLRNQTDASAKVTQTYKILNQKFNINVSALNKAQEKLRKSERDLMEADFRQKSLKEQVDRLSANLNDAKQALKRQSQRNQQNYTKLTKLQSDNIRLGFAQQQSARTEKLLKEREQQLMAKSENQAKLQIAIQKQQAQIGTLKDDLKNRVADFNREKQTVQTLKKEQVIFNDNVQTLQRQLQQKIDELSQLKRENSKISNDFKTAEDKLTQSVTDHKKYRQIALQSLKYSLSYLFGSREGPQPQIPDYDLAELQRQLIRKLNRLHEEHESEMSICKKHMEQRIKQQLELANQKHQQLYSQIKTQLAAKNEQLHYFREGMMIKNDELSQEAQSLHTQLTAAIQDVQVLCQQKDEISENFRRLLIDNEQLRAINDQKEREMANSTRDIKQLQEEIARERQHKEELFTKVYSEREVTHTQMQAAQRAMMIQIQQLESTLREREMQLDNTNNQIRAMGKEVEAKDVINKNLEKQVQHGGAAHQQLEAHINNMMRRQKQLLQKIRLGEQSIMIEQEKLAQTRSSLGMIQVKERQIEQLKLAFDREKDVFNKKILNFEQEKKIADQNLLTLRQDNEVIHDQLSRTNNQMRILSESQKTLENTLAKKSQQLQQKVAEINSLKEKIARMQRDLLSKDDIRNELTSRYQSQIQSLAREKDQLIYHLSQLEADLKKANENNTVSNRQLERQLSRVRSEKSSLERKIQQMQNEALLQIQSVKTNVEEPLLAEIESLRAFIQQTEQQNNNLQNSLELKQRQYNQLLKHHQSLDLQYKNLQKINKQTSMKLSEVESHFEHIKEERNNLLGLSNDKINMENEIKKLNQSLLEAHQQLQRLGGYCQSLEHTVEKYKQDKEFVYKQLRDEVQRNSVLTREKQQLTRVHEDKINGVLSMSSEYMEQRRTLQNTVAELTQKVNQLTTDKIRLEAEKLELFKRIAEEERERRSSMSVFQVEKKQLLDTKTNLASHIEQLSVQVAREKEELDKMYDREFRAMEAKRIQQAAEADQRIKRIYKEKYEDESILKFEIERLRAELEKGSGSLQNNLKSSVSMTVLHNNRLEYKQEMSQAKMKHFLAEEPLRNLQALIPHVIWMCQQNEKLVEALENRIRQLEAESIKGSRYVSPMKVMKETIQTESELVEKLRESDLNVRITFNRVEEMAQELEQLTEEKLRILGKSRQLQDMLAQGNNPLAIQDKVCEILDYSRLANVEPKIIQSSPFLPLEQRSIERSVERNFDRNMDRSIDRSLSIRRIQPGSKVIPMESWYQQSSPEVRRLLPNN